MSERPEQAEGARTAANDNGGTAGRLDPHLLTIARALGRQIAREWFQSLQAANDNDPARKDTTLQGGGR